MLSHHRRVFLGVFLPEVEHLALDHVRNVPPEPVLRQNMRVGVPLDATQVLHQKRNSRTSRSILPRESTVVAQSERPKQIRYHSKQSKYPPDTCLGSLSRLGVGTINPHSSSTSVRLPHTTIFVFLYKYFFYIFLAFGPPSRCQPTFCSSQHHPTTTRESQNVRTQMTTYHRRARHKNTLRGSSTSHRTREVFSSLSYIEDVLPFEPQFCHSSAV